LVYPDPKHATNVQLIINYLEELLRRWGFDVNKLCEKTPPDEHFGENFERLVEKCVLGIVILDGFRPNVLFEYGYLRGNGRVVLPIQHCDARIAIKSLYSLSDHASEAEIRNQTGLTQAQFNNLKEPLIGYFRQLSDRHGINVIEVDCNVELASEKHPKNKIDAELKKLIPRIGKLYAERSLKPMKVAPEHFKKFQRVTLQILSYLTKATPFESSDVEQALKEITELEQVSGSALPSTLYGVISSLYEILAERYLISNTAKSVEFYGCAIKLQEKILEMEK
jgi:hypothetical protein